MATIVLDFRHALQARPRLVLGILLAFGIEALRPTFHSVSHHHAGGERPHVHLGDIVTRRPSFDGGAFSLPSGIGVESQTTSTTTTTYHGPGLRASRATPLFHTHLLR